MVAEEVRALAGKCAEAANETAQLIETTVVRVEGGKKIAEDTASTFESIVEGVSKIKSYVTEISLASAAQKNDIAQLEQGISQISGVAQENIATSQQSAASTQMLSEQAVMLKEHIGNFSLK